MTADHFSPLFWDFRPTDRQNPLTTLKTVLGSR